MGSQTATALTGTCVFFSSRHLGMCQPEGEDTCDRGPVTWQPSQKASMPVARQGAGIYFAPLVPSSRPLNPTQEAKRNPLSLLSQLPPSSLKKELPVLCSLQSLKEMFIALHCGIPAFIHIDYF